MRCSKLLLLAAAVAWPIVPAADAVSAQEPDTLSISGPFRMYSLTGTVGNDLAQVYANGYDHAWTLTLYGVTTFHDFDTYEYEYYDDWGLVLNYYTDVRASSFDFAFSGPDADVLNDVVSQQLVGGDDDGVFLSLKNTRYYSYETESYIAKYGAWTLHLSPENSSQGVSFYMGDYGIWGGFSSDADGYPLVEPQRVRAFHPTILDKRPGSDGYISSFNDSVNIGSTEPPYVTPWMRIHDGSVLEGNRSTTRLNLIVTLTQFASAPITVSYATADGTASRKSDYTARSGTLTFQPGQSEATIPLAIKGDRKRESDETFTVRLSNADGAIIVNSVATATILNDD